MDRGTDVPEITRRFGRRAQIRVSNKAFATLHLFLGRKGFYPGTLTVRTGRETSAAALITHCPQTAWCDFSACVLASSGENRPPMSVHLRFGQRDGTPCLVSPLMWYFPVTTAIHTMAAVIRLHVHVVTADSYDPVLASVRYLARRAIGAPERQGEVPVSTCVTGPCGSSPFGMAAASMVPTSSISAPGRLVEIPAAGMTGTLLPRHVVRHITDCARLARS